MKRLLLATGILTGATLIWPKLWDAHNLSAGEMGAIFSLRELIGLAVALTALSPLLEPDRESRSGNAIPTAVVGILAGFGIISNSWGAPIGLALVACAFLLKNHLSDGHTNTDV
jgi:hypothetical protein